MNTRSVLIAVGVVAAVALAPGIASAPALAAQAGAPKLAPVTISPERRQMIGLRTAFVREEEIHDRIDTTGLVEPDERLQYYVQTRFPGWIRQVFANQTWQYVRKGEPLFTVYSPDLVSAENEYLVALDERSRVAASTVPDVAVGAESMVKSALERLRLFGVSPREIKRLERERSVRDAVEIDSPATGYISDRAALPNLYADPATRLFTITSLEQVWVYAAVFQDKLGEVHPGDPVDVTVDSYPGRNFPGRVDYVWPALDAATRTARVRCVFSNPRGALKLGMYVRIVLEPNLGRAVVIPASGVLRTGTRNVAFIDRGDGVLDPVDVELGPQVGDRFVVRKGLAAGQRIVSSANFLIDSESQLQAAIGGYTPPPPGATQAANAAPETARTEITTDPSPPARGRNQITVSLKDPAGKPLVGAQVNVTFYMAAMPAMGMAAMRAEAQALDQSDGSYIATLDLASGGTWTVTITAEKAGKPLVRKQLNMSVAGPMSM
jgi:multidrug efflux pump subunit AcrA (membrane-fusion protein)/nitrogen fixation protein FixH